MAALSAGMRLGVYEVKALLGAGGMGEVYLARDPRLERDVALKVLPAEAVSDATARARLVREARAAASLNHPNICTVYEVGEDGGHVYIAMELMQAETLAARLDRSTGGLTADEATRCALQIAAALAHAHGRGVIHCDLKSTNVMVTPDGWVRVLDFGLARRVADVGEDSPTWSARLTDADHLVGTPQYMAPELLLGSRADARSDIWSLGVLLHELLAGELPFRGRTKYELCSAILHDDATPLSSQTPAGLRMVVSRCLRKEPEQRYASAAEVSAALDALQSAASPGHRAPHAETPAPPMPAAISPGSAWRWPRWPWLTGAITVAALAGTIAIWSTSHRPPSDAPTQRQVTFTGDIRGVALSPDGRSIAFFRREEGVDYLVVQDVSSGTPLKIFGPALVLGTGEGPEVATGPKWSPDGSTLIASAWLGPDSGMKTYLIPRLGGTPRVLDTPGAVYAWSPDGRRIAIGWPSRSRLQLYDPESGDTSSFALSGDIVRMLEIDWSVARDRLLAVTIGRTGQHDLWTVRPDGREQQRIASGQVASAHWSCSGTSIYYLDEHGQTADLIRIDVGHDGLPAGRPVRIHTGLRHVDRLSPSSDGGSAVFLSADAVSSKLYVLDSSGTAGAKRPGGWRQLSDGTFRDAWPRVSPDGQWVAFTRLDEKGTNIYVMPVAGGPAKRLTFGSATCESPVWSPDGKEIAFVSDEGGAVGIWHVPAQGGEARPYGAVAISGHNRGLEWAPGARIVYPRSGGSKFGLFDPATGADAAVLQTVSAGWVSAPRYSPDGTKLAARWAASGRVAGIWEFGVTDTSKRLICATGDRLDEVVGWSKDGRWIYAKNLVPIRIAADGSGRREKLLDDAAIAGLEIASSGQLANGEWVFLAVAKSVLRDAWLLEDLPVSRNRR